MGTRQEKFYLKVAVVQDNQDFFTLPSSFNSGKFEDGDRRENSDYDKRNIDLMFGLTPTDEVDIMFGYAMTGGEVHYLFNSFIKDGPGHMQFHGLRAYAFAGPGGALEIAGLSTLDGRAVQPEHTFIADGPDAKILSRGNLLIFDSRRSAEKHWRAETAH